MPLRHDRPSDILATLALGAILVWSGSSMAQTEEPGGFRITGITGNVSLRYRLDDETVDGNVQSQGAFEEEVFVLFRGYTYHPNLMNFEVGAGPLFVQSNYKSSAGDNDSNDVLWNGLARFNFFEKKAYPFTVYYEQLNPTVYAGLGQTYEQHNEKYGLTASLRDPLSPVNLTLDTFHLETNAKGFNLKTDDTIDQSTLRAFRSFGSAGYGQLTLQRTDRDSVNETTTAPTVTTTSRTNSANFDSRANFGRNNRLQLTSVLSWIDQDQAPQQTDKRWFEDFRVVHSDTLDSFYRFNLVRSEVEQIDTSNDTYAAGVNFRPNDRTNGSVDVHGEKNTSTDFQKDLYGIGGSVSYRQQVGEWGVLGLGYGARYDKIRQEGASTTGASESITLTGTAPVPLANQNIVQSTIVVVNASCLLPGNECELGVDYDVLTVGTTTEIQRIATGNLPDPATVTVTYQYDTGGTFEYHEVDQSANGNLQFFRFYNAFILWRDSDPTLDSGVPTIELNHIRNTQYGFRADVPFWAGWYTGGEVIYEKQEEDIAPFNRDHYSAYLQMPLPKFSTLRFGGRRDIVDNQTSAPDSDITGAFVRYTMRPWSRALFTAESTYEKDTGGTDDRTTSTQAVTFDWRIRQLILRFNARYIEETQGSFERDRFIVRAEARRDF